MKLAIANTAIRQDSENRFSLNDLHVASGGEDRHQPSNFLRVEQTQALLAEISNSSDMRNKNPIVSKPGRYGGTYVAKELVYAYAMWISPKFSLEVIRTFDDVMTGPGKPTVTQASLTAEAAKLFAPLMRVARLAGITGNAATISANNAVSKVTGINILQLMDQTHLVADQRGMTYTPTKLGEMLGGDLSPQTVNKMLETAGLQTRQGKEWVATDKGFPHGEWYDTGKSHNGGTPVKTWKWFDTVLPLLAAK
jgi:hypothetical protein